ncbi:hypothetical protein OH77DRAFT_1525655 [Trametes cingulata]|nr:hypothetical protein OH77DRAFT_1525655 [Trametes cingulata]
MALSEAASTEIKQLIRQEAYAVFKVEVAKHRKQDERKGGRQKRKARKIPKELTRAVRENMRRLLGVRCKKAAGRAGKKREMHLPEPLPAGSTELRCAPDGTRLWNPEWSEDIDEGVNAEYIDAVKSLTAANGVAAHKLPANLVNNKDMIIEAAQTYFRSMRCCYQAVADADSLAKHERKRENDKHYGHRHRKADSCFQGIEAVEKVFGKQNTVGLEALVNTPWQSSEDSSEGAADPEVREAAQAAQGVGARALKVCALTWRSRKLLILHITLAVFARFEREFEDSAESVASEPGSGNEASDSEPELSAEAREEYLAKLRVAVQKWRSIYVNETQRYECFRGPTQNHQTGLPHKDKSGTQIYKECISCRWARANPEHSQYYARMPSCPDFTIFALDIPEDLIPADDLQWLANLTLSDDEAEEDA